MRKVTIVEVNPVVLYPPVISVIKNIMNKGIKVDFVGNGINELEEEIKKDINFYGLEIGIGLSDGNVLFSKIKNRINLINRVKVLVKESMQHSDLLWTTSYNTIRILGDDVTKYKHVMQLLELVERGFYVNNRFEFPLADYARKAWKVVVCEKNRAYIHKAMWGLEKLPIVLPNKPYDLTTKQITQEMLKPIDIMQKEERKIVLYLGGLWADRDLRPFASAIRNINDYVFYIVGYATDVESKSQLDDLVNNYDAIYLGNFKAPKHLEFVKKAYMGLLSYKTVPGKVIDSINALYCAPNKIYEYAAYGKPMIGNDILGLKEPFNEYNIGRCCDENSSESVKACIKEIENNYDVMSENCKKFFNDTNLDEIVEEILNDE